MSDSEQLDNPSTLLYCTQGWVLLKKALNKAHVLRLLNKLRDLPTDDIVFNGNPYLESGENDIKRQQSKPFQDPMLQRILEEVLRKVGIWSDRTHRLDHFVVLRSKAGCGEQWPHTDFDFTFKFNDTSLQNRRPSQLSILIAIEDGTKMVVETVSGIEEITVPVGCALVLHGGLVHAGAAYAQNNMRIHAYVGRTPDGKKEPNSTYLITKRVSRNSALWHTPERKRKRKELSVEAVDGASVSVA